MKKIIKFSVFILLFATIYYFFEGKYTDYRMCLVVLSELTFLALAIGSLFDKKKKRDAFCGKKGISCGTIIAICICVLLMPLTALFGVFYLDDRKYYFISLALILEIMLPFFLSFEGRKPKTGELVLISILSALAVLGRCAFYMLPQFKPMLAIVIVSGAVLGGETGFLIGAIAAFISNIFFGQGPWTPWQMLATGLVGFFAGLVFANFGVKKTRLTLSVFGVLSVLILYGVIMNSSSVLLYQDEVSLAQILAFCLSGLPFDIVNAISTVFFLWIGAIPMIEKIERVRTKYGLSDG